MTLKGLSMAALLIAVGQLLTAIGQKNAPAFYSSITAILACFLPAVSEWMTPPAKPA